MDNETMLEFDDEQLMSQCRKVLGGEEATAPKQPAAAPAALSQRTAPRALAALPAVSTQKPQLTLSPRDADATQLVELSEETQQRRATLLAQAATSTAAQPTSAAAAAAAPDHTGAGPAPATPMQPQGSAAAQQQPPAASKPTMSLCVPALLSPFRRK